MRWVCRPFVQWSRTSCSLLRSWRLARRPSEEHVVIFISRRVPVPCVVVAGKRNAISVGRRSLVSRLGYHGTLGVWVHVIRSSAVVVAHVLVVRRGSVGGNICIGNIGVSSRLVVLILRLEVRWGCHPSGSVYRLASLATSLPVYTNGSENNDGDQDQENGKERPSCASAPVSSIEVSLG